MLGHAFHPKASGIRLIAKFRFAGPDLLATANTSIYEARPQRLPDCSKPMSAGDFTGRREKRELQKLRVLISDGQGPRQVEYAWTENLSLNGARIRTDRPWEAGSTVTLNSSVGQLLTRARV